MMRAKGQDMGFRFLEQSEDAKVKDAGGSPSTPGLDLLHKH